MFSLVQRREKYPCLLICIFHLVYKSPTPNRNGSKTTTPNKWQVRCMCVHACGVCACVPVGYVCACVICGNDERWGTPPHEMRWPWTSDPLLSAMPFLFPFYISTSFPTLPRTLQLYEHKSHIWEVTPESTVSR